jgi:hypothetical protein
MRVCSRCPKLGDGTLAEVKPCYFVQNSVAVCIVQFEETVERSQVVQMAFVNVVSNDLDEAFEYLLELLVVDQRGAVLFLLQNLFFASCAK